MLRSIVIIPTLFILFFMSELSLAQVDKKVKDIVVKESKLSFLGKSKPISDLVKKKPTSQLKLEANKKLNLKPKNFLGRKASKVVNSAIEHQGIDSKRQSNQGAKLGALPLVNVDGLGDFNSPHDPSGDVGKNHYVQMINATLIGVFAKDGTLIKEFSANTLWESFGLESAGDPIVLYDEEADRWFITEFADPSNVLIAASATGDPLGEYYAYTFSTPDFPDYPKYALWPEALALTTNENGGGTLEQYFFERKALLQGVEDVKMQRIEVPGNFNTEGGFFVSTPVDWNGDLSPENSSPLILALEDSSWGLSSEDHINVFRINIDWNDIDLTTVEKIEIETSPYDSYPCSQTNGPGFSCVPQKGGSGIDALPEVIMNIPHYRNFGSHESIVFTFITDVTDGKNLSGIRWVELRRTASQDWSLYQEGTFAPDDGKDRYMGSIAIDGQGNIGLAYNVSSANDYVGIRYTGRNVDDPLGIMTLSEVTVVEGMSTINSGGRFGDYAQMSVDPEEDVFWYTSEYASAAKGSRTRIVAFEIARDSFDLAAIDLIKPITKSNQSNAEIVTTSIKNAGLQPIKDFTIGYSIDGVKIDSMVIDQPLASGRLQEYSFSKLADLSILPSTYEFAIWVHHPADINKSNDTLIKSIGHIYTDNAALLTTELPNLVCDTLAYFDLLIKNIGDRILESVEFEIDLDGVKSFSQIKLLNPLANGVKDTVGIMVAIPSNGIHDLKIQLHKANGNTIPDPLSTQLKKTMTQIGFDSKYNLRILFDKFPEENKWTLRYKVGNDFLYDVGPYDAPPFSTITEKVCLAKDTCYRFSFRDSAANGLCCDFGEGNISFTKASTGEVKFSNDGKFKFTYNVNFCTKVECALALDITTSEDNGNGEGAISIIAKDATGPFMYSIDGGLTFSDKPLFSNLKFGVYQIVVLSDNGNCKATQVVEVKLSNTSKDYIIESKIKIKPNPSNGYFHIELEAPKDGLSRISYDVIDISGKVMQSRMINKYSGIYESTVSIIDYPVGIYFIRFNGGTWSKMSRVVKE